MSVDPTSGGAPGAAVYDRLRDRLEQADELSSAMRAALRRADATAIDEATSRLETLALEFKLLYDEFSRAPEPAESAAALDARERLAQTAGRLTKTAAVHGGLLERLVSMSSALADTVQSTRGEPYGADGRATALDAAGLRLREQA